MRKMLCLIICLAVFVNPAAAYASGVSVEKYPPEGFVQGGDLTPARGTIIPESIGSSNVQGAISGSAEGLYVYTDKSIIDVHTMMDDFKNRKTNVKMADDIVQYALSSYLPDYDLAAMWFFEYGRPSDHYQGTRTGNLWAQFHNGKEYLVYEMHAEVKSNYSRYALGAMEYDTRNHFDVVLYSHEPSGTHKTQIDGEELDFTLGYTDPKSGLGASIAFPIEFPKAVSSITGYRTHTPNGYNVRWTTTNLVPYPDVQTLECKLAFDATNKTTPYWYFSDDFQFAGT